MKKFVIWTLVIFCSATASAGTVPYSKLVTQNPTGGCGVPFASDYLQTLAKVTQLSNGLTVGKMENVGDKNMMVYSDTPENSVIASCADLSNQSLVPYSPAYFAFRFLWLGLAGKIAYNDANSPLITQPSSMPNEEFVLTGSPGTEIEISEPLVLGDPKASFNYAWDNGYVLSLTSFQTAPVMEELSNELQATEPGNPGKGFIPITGPLLTIKAASNFNGSCGIILQQPLSYLSGIKLVGFPTGVCIKAKDVVVDRMEIEGSNSGIKVLDGGDNAIIIRNQIQNVTNGVTVGAKAVRVMGNVFSNTGAAAVQIQNNATATVRDNVSGSTIVGYDTPQDTVITGVTTTLASNAWVVRASIQLPKTANTYLTGDLYFYDKFNDIAYLIARHGCMRWGDSMEKISEIDSPLYQDAIPGHCIVNPDMAIIWDIPKTIPHYGTILHYGDHLIAVVTEGAQPSSPTLGASTPVLTAPFGGKEFGFATTWPQNSFTITEPKAINNLSRPGFEQYYHHDQFQPRPDAGHQPWWYRWRR